MKTTSQDRLGKDNILKLILSFATTTAIALGLNSIYTLTDSLMISWGVGDNAMGAISLIFPFVIFQGALSTALGGGAASIISRKIGKGELEEGGKFAYNAMVTFWVIALLVTIVGLVFIKQFLYILGATNELYGNSKDYFTIILVGNIFSTGFSAIIRAEGKMYYSLLIWVVALTLNIILDAIFIFVFKWGIKGSAYATVISQFVGFCISILFFIKFTTLKFKSVKFDFKKVGEILSVGFPALIQSLSLAVSLLVINNFLKMVGGSIAINTFAYVNKLIFFAVMPVIAITQAISPIIGYNYGANNIERIKLTVNYAEKISFIYGLISILLIEIFAELLIKMFTKNSEIINMGKTALRIIAISQPFMPFPMILGTRFQAEGKKLKAVFMFVLNLIIMVPCLLISSQINLNAVWWSYVVANFITMIIVLLYRYKLDRKIIS